MSSKHREQNVLLTLILLLPFGSYLASASVDPNSKCPDVFGAQCYCGVQPYGHNVPFNNNTGRPTFVTNCTNVNFTDVTILSHVPQETEVLIFTGNNFPVLPANVLDQSKKYDSPFFVMEICFYSILFSLKDMTNCFWWICPTIKSIIFMAKHFII